MRFMLFQSIHVLKADDRIIDEKYFVCGSDNFVVAIGCGAENFEIEYEVRGDVCVCTFKAAASGFKA